MTRGLELALVADKSAKAENRAYKTLVHHRCVIISQIRLYRG